MGLSQWHTNEEAAEEIVGEGFAGEGFAKEGVGSGVRAS